MIYKERSIWIMQYVGPPGIFAFRRVIEGLGAISRRAIVELTNQHFFFGTDGIYSFDGVSITPVSDRIAVDFFLALNQGKLHLNNALWVKEDFEVIFPFVSTSESVPSQALIYNYVSGAFGYRDLPATAIGSWISQTAQAWDSFASGVTWDTITGTWDSKSLSASSALYLFGDSSGFIYEMNLVDTKDGSDYEGYFITKVFDFGKPEIIKRVMRLQPLVTREGNYDLQIYVASLETPEDDLVFGAPVTLNLSPEGDSFVDVDVSGRYFAFKIRTGSKNQHFEMTGFKVYYMERGIR